MSSSTSNSDKIERQEVLTAWEILITIPQDGIFGFTLTGIVNGSIYWGDSSSDYLPDGDSVATHQYPVGGTYTVTLAISSIGNLSFTYGSKPYLVEVLDPLPELNITSFSGLFSDFCTSLTTIPSDLFINNPQITGVNYTFYHCTALTSIPSSIFSNNPLINSLYNTFNGCTSLTGPAPKFWDIFPSAYGSGCFSGATGLSNYEEIPISWGGLGLESSSSSSSSSNGSSYSSSVSSGGSSLSSDSSEPSSSISSFSSHSSSSPSSSSESSLSTVSSTSSSTNRFTSSYSSSSISSTSSSLYGFVSAPSDFRLSNFNSSTGTVFLSWAWENPQKATPQTPSGFVIEKRIGSGDWTLLNDSAPGDSNEYLDTLTDSEIESILLRRSELRYRVKAYWLV